MTYLVCMHQSGLIWARRTPRTQLTILGVVWARFGSLLVINGQLDLLDT